MADEQPRSKPAVLDLDEHVDELLEQMDSECARLESSSPSSISKDEPAAAAPPEPEPEPAVEEPEPVAGEPEPTTPSELDADLDAKVGEMIAEAERAETGQDAPAPPPSAAPPPLDSGENDADDGTVAAAEPAADTDVAEACLADLTSQLLEGDLDSADDAVPGSAVSPEAAAASESSPADPSATAPSESATATTPAVEPDVKPAAKAPGPVKVLAGKARQASGVAVGLALPVGAKGVMMIDAPLESRDPTVRQTVGWMAIYTGFLALCVWGYLLLVRSPPTPPAAAVPAAMVGESVQGTGESGEPGEPAASVSAEPASAEPASSSSSANVARQD
ncbi:MAG: hypothetical protein ACI89L_000729 [Phycisphaerales bacterium]|jgi:hypothetical protein